MLLSVIAVTPLYYPLLLQCHTPLHLGVQGILQVVTPRRAGIVIWPCHSYVPTAGPAPASLISQYKDGKIDQVSAVISRTV